MRSPDGEVSSELSSWYYTETAEPEKVELLLSYPGLVVIANGFLLHLKTNKGKPLLLLWHAEKRQYSSLETDSCGHLGLKLGQRCQLTAIWEKYASNIGDSEAEDKTILFLLAELSFNSAFR